LSLYDWFDIKKNAGMSALYFTGGVIMRKIVLSMLLMLISFGGTLAHAGDSTMMSNQAPALGKASSGGKYASSFIIPSTGQAWNGSTIFRAISLPTYYSYRRWSSYRVVSTCYRSSTLTFYVGIRMNGNVFQTYISQGYRSTGWVNGYARLNLGWGWAWWSYYQQDISFTGSTTGTVSYNGLSCGVRDAIGRIVGTNGPVSWGMSGISKN